MVSGKEMSYDPDQHHRRSIRLKAYDYASAGAYFVTICTQGHVARFGEIIDDEMQLNDAGCMVQTLWESIPSRFLDITSDVYVIMPNHFHAIVIIAPPDVIAGGQPTATSVGAPGGTPHVGALSSRAGDAADCGQRVGTSPAPTSGLCAENCSVDSASVGAPLVGALPADASNAANCGERVGTSPTPTRTTLGDVVGAFKSITTREYMVGVRSRGWPRFDHRLWQRNYWEHIVRTPESLTMIADYIINNPRTWPRDQLHPDNQGGRR